MICEKCLSKQATVHMQQIVNGEKSEAHLCADCAAAQGEMTFTFDNFFQGFLDNFMTQQQTQQPVQVLQCPHCGLTYPQFKSAGRLGCRHCYDTFRAELGTILKNVQASDAHHGKYPKKSGAKLFAEREIESMKAALRKAVENEAFEEAASLRDEIRRLQSGMGGDDSEGGGM